VLLLVTSSVLYPGFTFPLVSSATDLLSLLKLTVHEEELERQMQYNEQLLLHTTQESVAMFRMKRQSRGLQGTRTTDTIETRRTDENLIELNSLHI